MYLGKPIWQEIILVKLLEFKDTQIKIPEVKLFK